MVKDSLALLLFVGLYLHNIHLTVHPAIRLSVHPSLHLSVHPSIKLKTRHYGMTMTGLKFFSFILFNVGNIDDAYIE